MKAIKRIMKFVFWDYTDFILFGMYIAIAISKFADPYKSFVMIYMAVIAIKLMKIERAVSNE